MTIDKDEIEKYIFDPQNPQQCKSYKLLLRIAKKENHSFFSPEFLQYFFGEQVLNDKFKEELWDIPDNYNDLTFNEKIKLFKEQLSQEDLDDYRNSIDIDKININKIEKYSFISSLYKVVINQNNHYYNQYTFDYFNTDELKNFILTNIFEIDKVYLSENGDYVGKKPNHGLIIFSKNYFHILESAPKKASIFITLEENIDEFLSYETNENIKPIFLKKIEDVELLLNVLEKDLLKEKYKDMPKGDISNIDTIEIKDFFSIKNLKLSNLKDKKEIYILGENGDGKTLFLQAIASALKGVNEDGQGQFREIKDTFSLNVFDSLNNTYSCDKTTYENLFAYGAMRNNNCNRKDKNTGYMNLFDNKVDLKNPVDWFQALFISEKKQEENIISVLQAQILLSDMLNSEVEIEVESNNVTFKEKGSPIAFNRLSAGYRSVITIVCDMLFRLSTNQPYITDIKQYQGIVLIDEVELHLHPKWKYDFMKKLRKLFPLIQFIVTTHSPTVILGASKKAVFYKIYKEDGDVCISDQMANEGYTNNSLISSPLFDLKNITSRDYDKKISSDDFIYEKIHKVVSKRIKENINIDEKEILKLIDEELN